MKTILEELVAKDTATEFTDQQMGELGAAANRLIAKQQEIEAAEEQIKKLKTEERNISQKEIPDLMENLGFETITLTDGRKIAVKDSVQIAIPAPLRESAYKWMDANGHGDLIKTQLTAKFARGESDKAYNAFKSLEQLGLHPQQTETVHAGTLKAWAREEMAQGNRIPASLFKIHVVKITTVK